MGLTLGNESMGTKMARVEATLGTSKNCTPTTRSGGKYTPKNVQIEIISTIHPYSASSVHI